MADRMKPKAAHAAAASGPYDGGSIPGVIAGLFQFYFRYVNSFSRIHPEIHRMLPLQPEHIGKELALNADFADEFNRDIEILTAQARRCKNHRFLLEYETILPLCHVLRWCTCAIALGWPWWCGYAAHHGTGDGGSQALDGTGGSAASLESLEVAADSGSGNLNSVPGINKGSESLMLGFRCLAFVVGALQFVIAPFSFPISVMKLFTYGIEGLLHYVFAMIFTGLLARLESLSLEAFGGDAGAAAGTLSLGNTHDASFPPAGLSESMSPVSKFRPTFTIDARFLLWWVGIDQLLNWVCYLLYSEPFPLSVLVKHIIYGTLDTKLYWLIVFGALYGLEVDIVVSVLSSVALCVATGTVKVPRSLSSLSTFPKLWLRRSAAPSPPYVRFFLDHFPPSNARFFLDHRLGHIPVVYGHAHRMHHQFHDTTPWDAHTYGNGMNEHYFLMLLDVLPCFLMQSVFPTASAGKIAPYCFSFYLLYISLDNKPHHTRLKTRSSKGSNSSKEGSNNKASNCSNNGTSNKGTPFDGSNRGTPFDEYCNWHADHHKYHSRNYSLLDGALLDFYFATQAPKCAGAYGLAWRCERADGKRGGKVLITASAIDSEQEDSELIQDSRGDTESERGDPQCVSLGGDAHGRDGKKRV